ncbi:MAG: META domain-containing protein, partial [Mycobacterium sp.]
MIRSTVFALSAGVVAGLVGCSSDDGPRTLAGTSWRLVAIQSMDDAQGTTEVPDPSQFTVQFGDDGRAAIRLDCNTGSGPFEAIPTGDGASGTLTFGPVAMTLLGCPGSSLDQRVGAALPQVRGYLFADDQLNMSLMA